MEISDDGVRVAAEERIQNGDLMVHRSADHVLYRLILQNSIGITEACRRKRLTGLQNSIGTNSGPHDSPLVPLQFYLTF